MPVQLLHPGVYIEEVPSGVRTIPSVSTSVTAFVGRTARGPVEDPVECLSFGDFNRTFGGLWAEGPLSYAVRDFFLNGGSRAIVVRLFNQTSAADDGLATLSLGALGLVAANPGSWGNALSATVAHPTNAAAADAVAARYGIDAGRLYDLTVEDTARGTRELFQNVTGEAAGGARRLDRVLEAGSNLIRVDPDIALPEDRPADGTAATGQDGDNGVALSPAIYQGDRVQKTGLFALENTDIFNMLCIPPDTRDGDTATAVWQTAATYCTERRAFLIVDSPAAWNANRQTAVATARNDTINNPLLTGEMARNAAIYFPRIIQRDPLRDGQLDTFVPCGVIAGIIARTDAGRGVWKAPAGIDATLNGVDRLWMALTDGENGQLNPLGVNCLRTLPVYGRVVWGTRTMRGADEIGDEYKYVPVRRLALFIEESLYRGTQWVVFEPNDEPLWAQIRLNVGSFMQRLFRQGAFQGASPRDAYFVKCDGETTTQDDRNRGIVNIVVGFAPLLPAEFVVIHIQQIRNQA